MHFKGEEAFFIPWDSCSVVKLPDTAMVFAGITQCSCWDLHILQWMEEPHGTCDIL